MDMYGAVCVCVLARSKLQCEKRLSAFAWCVSNVLNFLRATELATYLHTSYVHCQAFIFATLASSDLTPTPFSGGRGASSDIPAAISHQKDFYRVSTSQSFRERGLGEGHKVCNCRISISPGTHIAIDCYSNSC